MLLLRPKSTMSKKAPRLLKRIKIPEPLYKEETENNSSRSKSSNKSKSSDKNSIKSKNSLKSKNSCLSNNSVKPRSQSKIMRFMKKSVPCLYKILNRN